jgi:hypothetical protein
MYRPRNFGLSSLLPLVFVSVAFEIGAQECAPHEVPAIGEAPPPERCRSLDLLCKQRNTRRQEEHAKSSMTFARSYSIDDREGDLEETSHEAELVGCAGTVVVPVITQANVRRVQLELIAPSGAHVLTKDQPFSAASGQFGYAELPESGRYRVRLRLWAGGQQGKECVRRNRMMLCEEERSKIVFPRKVDVRWGPNAGQAPLELGDSWSPTLERDIPATRRLRIPPDQAASLTFSLSEQVPLVVAVRPARGGSPITQRFPTGSGRLSLPESTDEQELIARVAATDGGPTIKRLSVSFDSAAAIVVEKAARRALSLGGTAIGTVAPGSASEEWEISGSRGEQLLLSVVPSGRSGTVVTVRVFSEQTEELVAERSSVAQRTDLTFTLPVTGRFLVEVTAQSVTSPDAEGKGRYTLELRRRASR